MDSTLGGQTGPQLSFDNTWSSDRSPPRISPRPSIFPFYNSLPPTHHRPYSYEALTPAAAGVTQAVALAVDHPTFPLLVDEHVYAATQPVSAQFYREPYPPLDGARGNYIACQWGRRQPACGTFVEATVTALVSHLRTVHGVYIEAKEETLRPICGSSFDEPFLNHQGTSSGWDERNVGPVSPGELLNQYSAVDTQDENPLAALTSNNPINLLHDATKPDGNLVPGSEFTCNWVERGTICTDRVNRDAEGIASHLERKHGVTSGSQAYSCRWDQCSTTRSMPKSSLIRHVREKHALLKSVCPTCDKSFTRRETLKNHRKHRHKPYSRTPVEIESLRSGFAPVASSFSLARGPSGPSSIFNASP